MGDKNPSKRKEVRKKISDSMIKNHFNSISHNIFSKENQKRLFSGTTLHYQGSYELDFLQKFYDKIKIENGKVFSYVDINEFNRKYISDFYLPEYNLIVEIKSSYTFFKSKGAENNNFKQNKVLNDGYNFIFIIDKNYEQFLKIINVSL